MQTGRVFWEKEIFLFRWKILIYFLFFGLRIFRACLQCFWLPRDLTFCLYCMLAITRGLFRFCFFISWADALELGTRRVATLKAYIGFLVWQFFAGRSPMITLLFDIRVLSTLFFIYSLLYWLTDGTVVSRALVISLLVFVCTPWPDSLFTSRRNVLVPSARRFYVVLLYLLLLMSPRRDISLSALV